jgi:acyl-CoA reductase-like NAD-dependent aldehyde dehydrogenase
MSEYRMTIGGELVDSAEALDVVNPASGEVFARVPACNRGQLDSAFGAAERAFGAWREDDDRRRAVLRACADAIEANAEELVKLQVLEQGMTLEFSRGVVKGCIGNFRRYAEIEIPVTVVQDDEVARIEVVRRPLGVIAAIRPWNFPVNQAGSAIAPSLRAGNTVVLKPSPYTPVATLRLGELLREVIPAGVCNIVSGPDPLGQWMTEHPVPRGIVFTGSVATGRKVNLAAAQDFKRVLLELGGNDPAVVLDDVDPEELAARLFWTVFRNTGQVCRAVKRVYVPVALHDQVAAALARQAGEIVVGNGLDDAVTMGPVNNRMQFDRVQELVADAASHGGHALVGGKPAAGHGYFYPPTVIVGAADGTRLVDEEQFGPVVPLIPYEDLDDAIRRANDTTYGLGASVWSGDLDRAKAVADRLEAGSVWINTHGTGTERAPNTGTKWSGVGSKGGIWNVYAVTDPCTIMTSRQGPTTYVPVRAAAG